MGIELPDWAWQAPAVRAALRGRDVGALFRFAQQYAGVSQGRIAAAVDMTQSRVNEVINGRRLVTRFDVFERVAEGLEMPDDARRMLGLAPNREPVSGGKAFDLAAIPEVVRVYSAQAAATADIHRQAAAAAEVDILAVRGLGLVGLNDSLLRGHLAREDGERVRLRVLLLDPECPELAVRAREIGESAESLAGGVRLAEARLRELRQVCDVAAYRYASLPTWRLVRLDRVLYVSAFDEAWEGHESAVYKVMETGNGPFFRGFRRMFDALAQGARRTV